MRRFIFALAAVCALERAASACATCNCGDPTITATGVEQPYKNRVRVALDTRANAHTLGDATYGQSGWSVRNALGAFWSPHARVTVGAMLPWVTSFLQPVSGDAMTLSGLGDLELSARVVVARDRRFAPSHLFWLMGGLKLPTGMRLADARGRPYPEDDQPGTGSWDPLVGATYAYYGGLVSVFASASYRITTPNERGHQRGGSLGFIAQAQLQPTAWAALALGLDGSFTLPDALPNGAPAPDTGGTMIGFAPAVLLKPLRDLLVRVGVSMPVVRALNGLQSEGPQLQLLLAYDIR